MQSMEHSVWTWLFFHIHGQLISSYNPVIQQTLSCLPTLSAIAGVVVFPPPNLGKQEIITPHSEMCETNIPGFEALAISIIGLN